MEIELRNLVKRYGTQHAVHDVSIALTKGEMIALLGPSGCGKTTTLRMVAGFIAPTSGSILFQDRDVTQLPPHRRDTGLVFQSYALFPHLTVAENIAFGLRRRRVPAPERTERIAAIIAKLKLQGLEERLPRQLSGGQQQRVAVARALVINPAILLLDEPFSNLDAKLRESTGFELRRVQRDLGLTSIFVTHDQAEAMLIADRIAVMNEGRIEQIGSAIDIYERPETPFVGGFIGSSNFFDATVEGVVGDEARLRLSDGTTLIIERKLAAPYADAGAMRIMVRPEHVRLHQDDRGLTRAAVRVHVEAISYQGSFARIIARLRNDEALIAQVASEVAAAIRPGTDAWAEFAPVNVRLFAPGP